MTVEAIFGLQFLCSLAVCALIARWYIGPWLSTFPSHAALAILLLPHCFRHIGMSFLVPGLVGDELVGTFAQAAAYGDLASAVFAVAAIMALRARITIAIPLVWAFNLLGTVDLANALRQVEVVPQLGVTWYIPTFVVPVLLVSHFMIFARLTGRERSEPGFRATAAGNER